MNGTNAYWRATILDRFADRENIGRDELYAHYFIELPKAEVFDCLDFIESEYELPAGLLRPEDKLTKLLQVVSTKNPWRWLIYQARAGNSEFNLQDELVERMQQHGTLRAWSHIETVDDFIRAWCGQKPN